MSEIKKPTSTKVGYVNYKIEYIDDLKDRDDDLHGKIELDTNKIKICNKYGSETKKATLLHEVVHAIEFFTGIILEEETVISFSNVLYLWMLENKDIVKYLISKEK